MTSLPTLPPFCLCFWHKLDFFSCTGGVLSLPQKTLNFNQKEEKEDGVMSTKFMRILNVAAGVLLIAAGIYCLCNQDVAVLSAGLLLGVFLLLAGIA